MKLEAMFAFWGHIINADFLLLVSSATSKGINLDSVQTEKQLFLSHKIKFSVLFSLHIGLPYT